MRPQIHILGYKSCSLEDDWSYVSVTKAESTMEIEFDWNAEGYSEFLPQKK